MSFVIERLLMDETVVNIALDCKHYQGDRPCVYKQRCTCAHYAPMGVRVLIIKLGALGDVVRTACVLATLKRRHPTSHITWVSRPSGVRILRGHPLIDRVVPFDAANVVALTAQEFDVVLSLDKEPEPAGLCEAIRCCDKRGIGLSKWGTVRPLSQTCVPYFELGLDNDLKFHHNAKSYPELIHEALGFEYRREPYRLYGDQPAIDRAHALTATWKTGGPVIGLNAGAGPMFANKAPSPARWVRIAAQLLDQGYTVALLGGPHEAQTNAWIVEQLDGRAHDAGCDHTEPQFVAIVDQCDLIVTGDTLALHVAVARDVPVVALFGPTCHQEIDLFDRGEKIVSALSCAPCYHRTCTQRPHCTDQIPIDRIVDAVDRVCETPRAASAETAPT